MKLDLDYMDNSVLFLLHECLFMISVDQTIEMAPPKCASIVVWTSRFCSSIEFLTEVRIHHSLFCTIFHNIMSGDTAAGVTVNTVTTSNKE